MYQKYANGLPLYRQEKDWKQYSTKISRTTLANWIIYCSQHYFQPMYDYSQPAVQGVQYCNLLFAVEDSINKKYPSDSVSGANASTVVYTMVEMAKAHDLNIYSYLKFLLEHRPTKEMTDNQLAP